MNIALTGGTGFLGRSIIRRLQHDGHDIVALTRSRDHDGLDPAVGWVTGDLRENGIAELVDSADVLVHAALDRGSDSFMDHPADPLDYFDANVNGSLRLIECAANNAVKRFIFISSGAVHQKVCDDRPLDETHPLWPASLYGAAKASVETLVHAYGLSGRLTACTIRPTMIYGRDNPLHRSRWYPLIRDVVAGRPVQAIGGGKVVHAADIAHAVALMLDSPEEMIRGRTFNVCDRFVSEYEVAEIANEIGGSEADIQGPPKIGNNPMSTTAIESLGMSFGGTALLRQTIEDLIRAT